MLTENDAAAFQKLEQLAQTLVDRIQDALKSGAAPALVQHVGPMLQVFFLLPGHEETDAIRNVRDFTTHVDRDRFSTFAHRLFDEGVYISSAAGLHSVLSTAHTEDDITFVAEAVSRVLQQQI
jgi:glutamate-1-semialdehyde 2,1-aminomutase